MADIISFNKKHIRQNFNRHEDPCSSCFDYPFCKNTCEKATNWWKIFAELFKEGKA